VSNFFYADCGCIGYGPLLAAAITIWGVTAWHFIGLYRPHWRHTALRKLSRRYRSHTAAENGRNTTPEGRRSEAPLEE
jgi:hypothetical protein